ncbi:phytoene desaturase [Acidiferrimicrobium sp. IK]|uniref:phytoene desaturase family protein n=1 Tax=Acidiferrimicrobium sp. IK TaxID=2871700 RepID=UPI0021CB1E4B|nr:phytoene desaturase family protein [Acidiferrimicrobium sp. IK]MCU4185348.1 phytoene desaturase [Acidiferrimicrobium sp. IK]
MAAAGSRHAGSARRVVVVGAGLGGLSAACHLVGRGYDVTVVEREDVPGGRAGLWESEGYRIDTGPSVLTMPGLLAGTFAAAGSDMADHITLRPLDPMYRASFAEGGDLRVRQGQAAMTEEIRAQCGDRDAAAFGRFCAWLERLYELEQPNFIDRNFDSPLDLGRPLGPALGLLRAGAFRRVASVVNSYFEDQRLQKLFSFQALYAGLSPFEALAIYCIITYMDTVEGVWFPDGGIHAVARGLAAAVEKGGGVLRYGAPVERILRRTGTTGPVTGVRLAGGERLDADVVVANPDLPYVYRHLLPETPMPRVARRGEYSPSCTLWLAGVKGELPPGAAHHNIHFGGDWKGSFDALLRRGTRQPDPAILVCVPTVSDPSLAPAGGHVIYALEPTPNLDGRIDWGRQRDHFRDTLVARLGGLGYPVDEVVTERFIDPEDWERQGMERGTPFALSHRFLQSGPFRPNNVDRRVPGLVLVGSGTLPGVSVPMVLVSGRLAAERVDQHLR